jgi:hypothetical protein
VLRAPVPGVRESEARPTSGSGKKHRAESGTEGGVGDGTHPQTIRKKAPKSVNAPASGKDAKDRDDAVTDAVTSMDDTGSHAPNAKQRLIMGHLLLDHRILASTSFCRNISEHWFLSRSNVASIDCSQTGKYEHCFL